MAQTNKPEVTGWVGWVAFAGIIMIMVGSFQAIIGLAAILEDDFWIAGDERMLVLDVTQWGWVHLIIGVVIVIAGASALAGRGFGRVVGIFLAMGQAIANLGFIEVTPFWSILVISLDVLVIYALAVHGHEAAA